MTGTPCFSLLLASMQIRKKHLLWAGLALCQGAWFGEQNSKAVPPGRCKPFQGVCLGRNTRAGLWPLRASCRGALTCTGYNLDRQVWQSCTCLVKTSVCSVLGGPHTCLHACRGKHVFCQRSIYVTADVHVETVCLNRKGVYCALVLIPPQPLWGPGVRMGYQEAPQAP